MDDKDLVAKSDVLGAEIKPFCTRLIEVVTKAKPGATIVRFWQGIVDVILRAIVVGLSLSLFIMNAGLSDYHSSQTNGLPALAGWGTFATFILMLFDVVTFIGRFINFSCVHQYPLPVVIVDVAIHIVAMVIIFPELFTAIPSSQLQALTGLVTGYTVVLFLVLGALSLFSVLWYVLKWFCLLKAKYEENCLRRLPTS